jgi:hypothetical protein
MGEHGMHSTIFLTEKRLMMLSLLNVVNLHTTITFRGEKQTPFIVKIQRRYRS